MHKTFRLTEDLNKPFADVQAAGLSVADIVRTGLGLIEPALKREESFFEELSELSFEDGYKDGRNDGFHEGLAAGIRKADVIYRCFRCDRPISIADSPEATAKAVWHLTENGWATRNAHDPASSCSKSGCAKPVVAHHRAVLRGALNVAMRHGIVHRNAAALADPPRIPQREYQAITPDAARALLAAVRGDRLEALFTVALSLGLRKGETLGLRWSDTDLDDGTLMVQRTLQRIKGEFVFLEPKTKSSQRTVALPSQVIEALRAHHSRQLAERLRVGPLWVGTQWGDLVFADETGRPLSTVFVSRRFKKLLATAGLPTMRYHDLRHGAASLMAVLGIPPRVAMEILGHAQISTTMNIYAHVAPELQRDAANRLGAALWATG